MVPGTAYGHTRCLQRLLKAAGVPASLPAEAVYAVLLQQLSLQGPKGPASVLAYSNSLAAAREWLALAQSAAQPAQLPCLRSFHTTAVQSDDRADLERVVASVAPSTPAQAAPAAAPDSSPLQDLVRAAATAAPSTPAQAAPAEAPDSSPVFEFRDLVRAAAAAATDPLPGLGRRLTSEQLQTQQQQQQRQPPQQQSKRDGAKKGGKVGRETKGREPQVFTSRLFEVSQQLSVDAAQVKRSEHAKEVQQKVQQMDRRRQQQLPPPAQVQGAAAGGARGTAAAAPSPLQQQEVPSAPRLRGLSSQEFAAQIAALKKQPQGLDALLLLRRQQQQQQLQQAAKQQGKQQTSQAQALKQTAGLPSLQAVVRMAPALRRQQQQTADAAGVARQQQRPPGSYKLPLLVEYMLQQQQQHQHQALSSSGAPAAAAAAAATTSDAAAGLGADAPPAAPTAAAPGQARYSDWVDLDTNDVVVRDAHDTFLGVWPQASGLPELQLAELLEGVYAGSSVAAVQEAAAAEAAEAEGRLLLDEQQQQQGGDDEVGYAAAVAAEGLRSVDAAAAAGAEEQEGKGTGSAGSAGLDLSGVSGAAFQQHMDVTEGEGEEEAVDADQQLATVAPAAAEEEEGGEKGEEDSAAGSSIAAWDDDAAVTLAAAGFWQAEAGTDAGSGAELVQLWEEDGEDGTAADAAAVEDVAAVDPAVLRQQQLRQAAATAGLNLQGGAALFADADAAASEQDSSWEEDEVLEGDQQLPGWTVERLFDCLDAGSVDSAAADAGVAGSGTSSSSSSGLSSQHAAAEQLLQDSEWVLDCLDGSSGSSTQLGGQQQQQQFVYGDSLEAAAAAQAALRASDAAAAAAAAVQPPNLQVPAHLPILFALQCTVHELERSPHLAGAFQLDSSSNNSESHVAQSEPPFAWMYPAAGLPATAAAAAGSQQPAVVQHILRTLQNADPRGNWRFELPPTVLPNSSELLPPLDSSLQQYVLTSAQQQQRLQRRLDARDRQSRLLQRFQERVQELRGAVVTPAQDPLAQSRQSRLQEQVQELWGAVVLPAQDPLVQSLIESAPRPLKPFVQLLLDPMSLFRSSSSSGGGSSQLPAADAAAADADTADACGDEQQQQQEEEEEDSQEQLLLARVTEMSVGTYWEPFAWSVLTQQPTQVANGRLADPTVQQRLPLSRPLSRQAARAEQQQREQDLQQQRQRRQQQMQAAQVQKAAAAASDWFGPILYAAYAATQQVGQLVLAPVLAQQDSIPVTPGSSGSSSSNGAAASSTAAVAPATLALQAVPPSQPGWDPLTRAWQGVYLPPREAVPSRAQLAAELQREVRLVQAAIQWARAKAPVCLHLQSDAARDVILAEFQDCQTAAALLECMQQYAHYVDHYPDLPAAALQQAAKLWAADAAATTAPAAAAEAAGGAAAAAAAAAPAGAGSVGRRQRRKKLLSAAAEADTLSISISSSSSSSSSGSQGVSVFAAAAAAGGNIDALITASVQLPNPLATGEDPAKSSLFDALVAWLTKTQATRQQPLEQLLTKHFPATLHADILQQHSAASSAASSSNSNSAELPAGAGSQHSTAQCLVQLLTLGMDHRGSALPAGISLLQLLQQQQLGQLSLATILQLSQQLLSPGAALQTWPAAEQHAAFQLLHDGVKHLLPQALLQLLTLLTRQQHLGSLPSELLHQPGALYRAVLAQLAVQAAAVLGGQSGQQLLGEFAAAGPQLLQLAQQACLSAGALTLQAHQDGIVLPGSSYFTQAVNSASYPRTGPEYRGWVIGQHKDFISRLRACRKQAAATPVVADAVLRAGASGHLQKVAAVLRVLMAPPQKQPKQQQQQQFDAAQAAELLQMLACARPFVNFSGMWDARQVANRFSESEADLRAGANAFAHLPGAVAAWLVQQQGQEQSTPVQQLPPEAILRTLRAALQLQLAHKSVLACVDSLCECPPAAAGTSTAASSSDSTSSSSSNGGSGSTHLHGWSVLDLHRLLELTRTEQLHLSQQHLDVIASAAAQRAHELVESFAAAAGLGSTLDLSAYTAGGPAAALAADAKSERGRRRSGAAAAAAAADPQWLNRSLYAVCDTAFSFSIRDQYQPQLLYALQELLVVAARASFNSSSSTSSKGGKGARTLSSRLVRIMQPANFTKALYCLAAFNSCSAQTSAAVRQLLPSYLPALQHQGLSRMAWALAVLNERDARVWADVRHAIAHRDSRGMRAAADAEDGLQEGLTAAAAATEKTPGSQQWIYTQVHQANVFVEHCVPAAAPLLPPELARKALDVHAGLAQDPTVSQLQRDVGHVLGEMQASATSRLTAYELEHKTVLGSTDIKVSMQDAQCKVAVEVDGPFHYAKNPPYKHTQRTGSTVLRDRLLEVKGFAVLCLPYWDIGQQKQAGDKAMLAWMEGLLVKAAATPPPRSSSGESSGRVDLEAYRSTL